MSNLPASVAKRRKLGESLYGKIRFCHNGFFDEARALIEQMDSDQWEVLLEFADQHRVAADLAHWINTVLQVQLRTELQRQLVYRKLDGRKSDDKLYVQLKAISEALIEKNIPYVFLKGAALISAGYYDFPGQRLSMDIDLLVDLRDLDRAYDALVELGFTSELNLTRPISPYWNSAHIPPLLADQYWYRVECHCRHFENTFMFDAPFDTAEIMQKSRKVLVDGVPIYVPSGSHLLVSAFYHSQISDVHALTNSDNYRALMDVSRILASDNAAIDWEFIEGRVNELSLIHI